MATFEVESDEASTHNPMRLGSSPEQHASPPLPKPKNDDLEAAAVAAAAAASPSDVSGGVELLLPSEPSENWHMATLVRLHLLVVPVAGRY